MKTDWSNYTIDYDGVEYRVHYRDSINLVACEDYIPASPSPRYPSPITAVTSVTVDGIEYPLPPLHKIGDVADELDIVTGQGIRRCGVKVFDGTEAGWAVSNEVDAPLVGYSIPVGSTSADLEGSSCLCSHMLQSQGYTKEGIYRSASDFVFIVNQSDFPTLNDFKALLGNSPVTVVYQLAEPEPFTVDPIVVPTTHK